jgi:MoxR-like ATPase
MLALQTPAQRTKITLDELQAAQGEAEHVKIPDDILVALTNLREILRKENIIASDRRYKQALSLIRASAYLGGRQQAAIEDLTILQHVLWSQPTEQKVVQKIVLNTINPTLSRIQELLDLAAEVYHQALDPNTLKDPAKASEKGIEANVKLKKISEELAKLQTTPTTAQTLIGAQAKVNAYTAEILEKLLGLSPTPAAKKYA